MTSKEFVVWMQGFVEACNDYSPTPKQWDTLKDKLGNVADPLPLPFGGMLEEPLSLPKYQQPRYIDQHIITCTTGSATYNPSTSTQWNASGSLWSYTDALDRYNNWYWTNTTIPQQPTTGSNQLELEFETK